MGKFKVSGTPFWISHCWERGNAATIAGRGNGDVDVTHRGCSWPQAPSQIDQSLTVVRHSRSCDAKTRQDGGKLPILALCGKYRPKPWAVASFRAEAAVRPVRMIGTALRLRVSGKRRGVQLVGSATAAGVFERRLIGRPRRLGDSGSRRTPQSPPRP